jgi:hypothetical protein
MILILRRIFLAATITTMIVLAETGARSEEPSSLPDLGASLGSFADFDKAVESHVMARWRKIPSHWRAIEPSLYFFILDHQPYFRSLPRTEQFDFIGQLANFIARKRRETGQLVVIGPRRPIIALLDPLAGLDSEQVAAFARHYDAPAQVFKLDAAADRAARMRGDFLAAVRRAAASDQPVTIVVLGHGLQAELVNSRISDKALGDALLAGAKARASGKGIDLGHLTIIVDACFSADFVINLGKILDAHAQAQGFTLQSPPVMISSVNRGREGHGESSEKITFYFWGAVLELFDVREPRPRQVTLQDFFDRVDHYMYGYGRAPIVVAERTIGYRVVDRELIQDPVCFVPLTRKEAEELLKLLGMPPETVLPGFFDIGDAGAAQRASPAVVDRIDLTAEVT